MWVLTIGVLEVNPEVESIRAQRGRARSALFSRVFIKGRTQENRFGDNTWEYLGCVNHYRNAISTMLQNVPKDPCLKRQESVKRRIYQYVKKTESLIKKEEEESTSCNSSSMPYLRLFGDLADLRSGLKINFFISLLFVKKTRFPGGQINGL